MSSKRSPAARIIEFFTTQPIGEADLVFGLVRDVIKRRKKVDSLTSTQTAIRKRMRKAKVNARPLIDPKTGVIGVSTATPEHPREV